MSNPSKDKGTKWETRIADWLKENGYPNARRNVTTGSAFDPADIDPVPSGSPPIIIQAKFGYGGRPCQACHHVREVHAQTEKFDQWWFKLHETRRRRNRDGLALLCLHRAGKASPMFAHWYAASMQLYGPGVDSRVMNLGPIKITGPQALKLMSRYANPETPS